MGGGGGREGWGRVTGDVGGEGWKERRFGGRVGGGRKGGG